MSKRTSGLGRGLGDLLADNAPEVHGGATVVWRDGDENISLSPERADAKVAHVPPAADGAERTLGVDTAEQSKGREEQLSIGVEFFSAPDSVVAEEMRADLSETAEETIDGVSMTVENTANEAEGAENIRPHRSLKALFKSYK